MGEFSDEFWDSNPRYERARQRAVSRNQAPTVNQWAAVRAASATLERAQAALDEAIAKAAVIGSYGPGEFEHGTALAWEMRFKPEGKVYSYIALFAEDRVHSWFITGRRQNGPNGGWLWSDLVSFWIEHEVTPDQIWRVDTYVPLLADV